MRDTQQERHAARIGKYDNTSHVGMVPKNMAGPMDVLRFIQLHVYLS